MEAMNDEKKGQQELENDDDVMLPGYRFHPTDEELVGFYLRRKVEKKPLSIELIKQIDIYKHDPWDLPKVSIGDKEWYFFCMRGRKYRNSVRPNRVTGSGFWKATGIDKPIHSLSPSHSHQCIGLKKSLVYYRGSAGKGTKTDWMMHEFRLPPPDLSAKNIAPEAEVWTLCRIFKRIPTHKKYTPDLKLTNKNKTTDSGSFESDNYEHYASFCDSLTKQNETKPILKQPMFMGHMNMPSSRPQAPLVTSFWNPNRNGDDFFIDGSWDELRSVVELANIDPSLIYGCRLRPGTEHGQNPANNAIQYALFQESRIKKLISINPSTMRYQMRLSSL